MEQEIQTILEPSENVVWNGKQDLKSTMVLALFGLLALLVIGYIFLKISSSSGTCTVNGAVRPAEECGRVFGLVGYGIMILALLAPLGAYLHYKVTRYVITDKRVLLKSGLIGADMRSIYYDQIRSAFVNVGIIGKLFGTGSILLDTGRMTQTKNGTRTVYDRFKNIHNPYEVYKILQDYLSSRKEGLHSGRADYEGNKEKHKDYVQQTERWRKQA